MKSVCAWCNTELDNGSANDADDAVVSHGICVSCREYFFSTPSRTLDNFLNKMDKPVMVINNEGQVALANDKAQTMLGKDLGEISGYKGGDVMECAYARLPEGCGNTTHCLGCTIRNNIMLTFETGKSLKRVPALLNRAKADSIEKIHFHVSTEKINDVVLLRIDDVA